VEKTTRETIWHNPTSKDALLDVGRAGKRRYVIRAGDTRAIPKEWDREVRKAAVELALDLRKRGVQDLTFLDPAYALESQIARIRQKMKAVLVKAILDLVVAGRLIEQAKRRMLAKIKGCASQ